MFASVGFEMPCVHDVVPLLDVDLGVEALTAHLQSPGPGSMYCPLTAPTQGVVSCTYEQWLKSCSLRRRHCQLLVSERRLQFRLGFRACLLLLAICWCWSCRRGLQGFFGLQLWRQKWYDC